MVYVWSSDINHSDLSGRLGQFCSLFPESKHGEFLCTTYLGWTPWKLQLSLLLNQSRIRLRLASIISLFSIAPYTCLIIFKLLNTSLSLNVFNFKLPCCLNVFHKYTCLDLLVQVHSPVDTESVSCLVKENLLSLACFCFKDCTICTARTGPHTHGVHRCQVQ